ncbi:MAG: aminodeoxychorismate synthase component I [Gemmatimonadales bacterium]
MDQELKPVRAATDDSTVVIELEPQDPVTALARFTDFPEVCLLHSASPDHPASRYSFLAADPVVAITGVAEEWIAIRDRIRATIRWHALPFPDLPPFQGGWIGWFGYELGVAFDNMARHGNQPSSLPDVALGLHDWVVAWDHAANRCWLISTGSDTAGVRQRSRAERRARSVLECWNGAPAVVPARPHGDASAVSADFTAATYQNRVETAIEYVLAGDIFQVNLSQRFVVPYAGSALELYRALCRRSAAPMAAFVQAGGVQVISASPERFVRLDPRTREVDTCPIKGTRPRHSDPHIDAGWAQELLDSDKDRAENVMIVDLLRNDLARVCKPGTIRVPRLNQLESHPTVHHLVSTVSGTLREECDALDLLAATFPGGSITGAPKLRAMSIIRELEPVARGVYSGSVGWIGLDGGFDSSIAIRTITLHHGIATCHAGGGITADSEPAAEYSETLDKARALVSALSGDW